MLAAVILLPMLLSGIAEAQPKASDKYLVACKEAYLGYNVEATVIHRSTEYLKAGESKRFYRYELDALKLNACSSYGNPPYVLEEDNKSALVYAYAPTRVEVTYLALGVPRVRPQDQSQKRF